MIEPQTSSSPRNKSVMVMNDLDGSEDSEGQPCKVKGFNEYLYL